MCGRHGLKSFWKQLEGNFNTTDEVEMFPGRNMSLSLESSLAPKKSARAFNDCHLTYIVDVYARHHSLLN